MESEKADAQGKPKDRLTFLGRLPVDPNFVKVVDGPESGAGLVERYQATQSSVLFADIAKKIVEAVKG